jgi:putative pyruvate formate lyase activating enzyme
LLDGVIDIYLPDAKYSEDLKAEQYSQAPRYWQVNQAALREMHRQVGDLTLDENGIAVRGLIIRHLVLPQNIAGSIAVLKFIAAKISTHTHISVMAQFHPAHRAGEFPELSRRLTQEEYDLVINKLQELGLANGWIQEL